jgi:hypothetical protein
LFRRFERKKEKKFTRKFLGFAPLYSDIHGFSNPIPFEESNPNFKNQISNDIAPTLTLPHKRLCRNMKKPTYWKGRETVTWKRFRAVTFNRSDSGVPSK